jgi:hypothetical protein
MRASNFVRNATDAEFRAFSELLRALHQRLDLRFKLFQMSGSTFCDDQQLKPFLDRNNFDKVPAEILSALDQEQNFIEIARNAYGTVSMSFHGCVLSMVGGCPAVPVTSERYYDYNYADFDHYTGSQDVPVVSLQDINPDQAAAQISQWYRQLRDNSRTDNYEANAHNIEATA